MTTYIISDVHLGSPHCRVELLRRLLAALPADCTLVLNGDTLDDPARPLPSTHAAAWQHLVEVAAPRPVVLVRGNHDDQYALADGSPIQQVDRYAIGTRLMVAHGHAFGNLLDKYRWFVDWFDRFHRLRVRLGAHPVHVADFAKHFKPLYAVLCRSVRQAATEEAAAGGFAAVTCGHVHFPEDREVNGVRYLNTGCWTERATFCVEVTDREIRLVEVEDLLGELISATRFST